jgi:hypothetical protein
MTYDRVFKLPLVSYTASIVLYILITVPDQRDKNRLRDYGFWSSQETNHIKLEEYKC